MLRNRFPSLLAVSAVLVAAEVQPWKDKAVSDWTEEDAKQVLAESPWAKTVHPTMQNSNEGRPQRRGMGRSGGVGIGGIGIGLPGGMGRRYPGGGYPGGGHPGGPGGGNTSSYEAPPVLRVRWESAQPIREAELKARETNAPTLDERHYAIAVYGVPERMVEGDAKTIAGQLKKQATIKRDGKKDWKPSSVEVLRREDGPVIVYLFPRTEEITRQDKRLEFTAKIQKLEFTQPFYVDEMIYRGKVEL